MIAGFWSPAVSLTRCDDSQCGFSRHGVCRHGVIGWSLGQSTVMHFPCVKQPSLTPRVKGHVRPAAVALLAVMVSPFTANPGATTTSAATTGGGAPSGAMLTSNLTTTSATNKKKA